MRIAIIIAILSFGVKAQILAPIVFGSGSSAPCTFCFKNTGAADSTGGVSTLATSNFTVASGDLIVCTVDNAAAQSLSSVTDTQSNTYTLLLVASSSQNTQSLAYAKNVTGFSSAAVTAHYSASTALAGIACAGVHGPSTSTPLDLNDNSAVNNGLIVAPASQLLFGNTITTANNVEAVVIGVGWDRAITTASIDHSYSVIVQSTNLISQLYGKITSSTLSSEGPTLTLTTPSAFFAATAASFK